MERSQKRFTEKRFPVPWGHIAAKVYGSSSRNRVLMVHGIMDNAGSFDRLLPLLPEDYEYVCIDLPGHGFSSPYPPGVPLYFFNYVHCIQIVLDALGWESCTSISHSLGAQLSVYFSIMYPERIEKLICLDGIAPRPVPNEHVLKRIKEVYSVKDDKAKRTYTKEEVLYALQFRRKCTLNVEAAEALFTRAVTKVGDMYMYNRDPRLKYGTIPLFSFAQFNAMVRKLPVPTLLISADGSNNVELIRILAKNLQSELKDRFRCVCVAGNHDVHNNNPEAVAPHVCAFLQNNMHSKL